MTCLCDGAVLIVGGRESQQGLRCGNGRSINAERPGQPTRAAQLISSAESERATVAKGEIGLNEGWKRVSDREVNREVGATEKNQMPAQVLLACDSGDAGSGVTDRDGWGLGLAVRRPADSAARCGGGWGTARIHPHGMTHWSLAQRPARTLDWGTVPAGAVWKILDGSCCLPGAWRDSLLFKAWKMTSVSPTA